MNNEEKAYTDEEARLVPEIKEWNGGDGIDLYGWISCIGTYEFAIGYSQLFWPKFILYDGCLLRDGFDEENYREWVAQMNGDKRSVESMMNHVHLASLLPSTEDSPTEEQLIYLGRTLKEMWQAKINLEFPDLKVVVHFEEEKIEWFEDYVLTIFQE